MRSRGLSLVLAISATLGYAGVSAANASTRDTNLTVKPSGQSLYEQHCSVCHMPDGSGVFLSQPPLAGSSRANGAAGSVAEMILYGSEVIPIGTSQYRNEMGAFDFLSDEAIAALSNYVRGSWGNAGDPVGVDTVAALRARGAGTGPHTK